MKFATSPCCCGCVIFADDFNRADDTDLGADWTEGSGDWEIVSNRLRAKGGTDDQVCTADATNGTSPVYLSVKVIARAWGDQLRLFTNGGTVYVEIAPLETTGTGWVKLVTTTGSVEAQVDFALDTEYTLTLCIVDSGSSFYAVATGGGETLYRFTAYTSSSSGVATGVLDDIADFDDFSLQRTASENDECQDCSTFTCGCLPGTPPQIQVDFETEGPSDPIYELCDCDNIGTVLLDRNNEADPEFTCEWEWNADPDDIEELMICQVVRVYAVLLREFAGAGTYTISGGIFVGYKEVDNSITELGYVTFSRTFSNSDNTIDCETLLEGSLTPGDDLLTGLGSDYYCRPVTFDISVP